MKTWGEIAGVRSLPGRRFVGQLGILPVLAFVFLLFSLLTPNFLAAANLINVTRQASINMVLATRGIDLAVGSVLAVSAVISVMLSLNPEWAWAAVPASLAVGAGLGAATGMIVAYADVPPFIVTLGTYTALRGAAYLLARGTTVMNAELPFSWIGNAYVGPVPWLAIIAGAVVLLSGFALRFTVLGLRIYATGANPEAARLTGINVGLILLAVYTISGLLAALGGVMSASRLYSANGQIGIGYELDAIAAAIVGGTSFSGGVGGVIGTLYGALIIAVLNNGLTLMNVSYYWQLVVKGAVIVAAVGIDRFRRKGG